MSETTTETIITTEPSTALHGDFWNVTPPGNIEHHHHTHTHITKTVQVVFSGQTSPHAGPTQSDGLWIVQGDDYRVTHNRAITFKTTTLSAGAICSFELTAIVDGSTPFLPVKCSIIPLPQEPDQVRIVCELTADQTSRLYVGDAAYTYRLRAEVEGHRISLLEGAVSVTE